MSEIVELLQAGRDLAWLGLVPAFDHAILLAQEAEYVATQARALTLDLGHLVYMVMPHSAA